MRHSPLLVSISTLAFAVSLSGCASLQSAFADMKSGTATSPAEMQQANFIEEEPIEYETLIEPCSALSRYGDAGTDEAQAH